MLDNNRARTLDSAGLLTGSYWIRCRLASCVSLDLAAKASLAPHQPTHQISAINFVCWVQAKHGTLGECSEPEKRISGRHYNFCA